MVVVVMMMTRMFVKDGSLGGGGAVGVRTKAPVAVQLTLLDVRVGLIVANDGATGCAFEAFRVKFDLADARVHHHHRSRHHRLTVATALAKAVVVVLATVELAILLEVPAAQLVSAYAAPVVGKQKE